MPSDKLTKPTVNEQRVETFNSLQIKQEIILKDDAVKTEVITFQENYSSNDQQNVETSPLLSIRDKTVEKLATKKASSKCETLTLEKPIKLTEEKEEQCIDDDTSQEITIKEEVIDVEYDDPFKTTETDDLEDLADLKQPETNLESNSFEIFQCDYCSRFFRDKLKLKKHIKMHKGMVYRCTSCSEKYLHRESLMVHHKQSHGWTIHTCPFVECGKSFRIKTNLARHVNIHIGSKTFVCEMCTKGFNSACNLAEHKKNHNAVKPFKCKKCSQSFKLKMHLLRHSKIHNKPFKCHLCSSSFQLANLLEAHVLRTHIDGNKSQSLYVCNICPKSFKRRAHLKRHLNTHDKNANRPRDFKCNQCANAFFTKKHLLVHLTTHERKFKCFLCTSSFNTFAEVNDHIGTIHVGVKVFVCGICSRPFKRKNHRDCHVKTHTATAEFKCTQCDRSYVRKDKLKTHMQKHNAHYECTKFKCELCDKEYTTSSSLKRHFLISHCL